MPSRRLNESALDCRLAEHNLPLFTNKVGRLCPSHIIVSFVIEEFSRWDGR